MYIYKYIFSIYISIFSLILSLKFWVVKNKFIHHILFTMASYYREHCVSVWDLFLEFLFTDKM